MTYVTSLKRKIQVLLWNHFWNSYQLPDVTTDSIDVTHTRYEPQIKENICLPPYEGDSNFDDYAILISTIKSNEPKTILELGTAHGNTTANICVESAADIYTLNALPEQIDGNIITFMLGKDEIGSVYRKNGFESRVTQIYENTKNLDVLEYLSKNSIDFVFIDACHDAEYVVNDFYKILPALSDSACVIFHDTHPSVERHLLDSYLGCMYLRKKGYNIVHISGSSFGYWSRSRPRIRLSFWQQTHNSISNLLARILFNNEEKFIKELRWLASVFLRGKGRNEIS